MALRKFEKDMGVIAALDDEPNDVGGLSAQQLKEKFDEGGQAIKTYLNEMLLPDAEATFATKRDLDDMSAGISPDLAASEYVLEQL